MKSYELVNGWRSREEINVNGIKPFSIENPHSFTTEPFECDTVPWALAWSLLGQELKVLVTNTRTGAHQHSQSVMDLPEGGRGISYIYDSGTYVMEIEALGEWIISVANCEEEPLAA